MRTIGALAELALGGTSIHLLLTLSSDDNGAGSPGKSVGEHSFKLERRGSYSILERTNSDVEEVRL